MMGWPVNIAANGGLAVTENPSGNGLPYDIAPDGFGYPITFVDAGGLPVNNLAGLPVFLSADSLWKTPLPASPTIATNSAAYVAKLTGWGAPASPAAGVYGTTSDFDVPVYQAKASDPLFTISATADARDLQINGMQIRIPDAATPAGGSDAHLVVIDENKEWVYEFWSVSRKDAGGGTIAATAAGRTRYAGDGFDNADALAAKTAAYAGLVTPTELKAGAIEHAIAFFVKSTDGTNVWPASANAGNSDPTNAPPCGAWFQYNRTFAQIDADAATYGWPKTAIILLKAMSKYGMIVTDTGGASWNFRFLGDASTASLGGAQPMRDYAVAEGNAGGWYNTAGIYYFSWPSEVDWADNLRALDPATLHTAYDARVAYKKLDPVSTNLDSGPWTKTGGATIDAGLLETTYAPFAAAASPRIGASVVGYKANANVETLVVPTGKKLRALTLWYYGNAAAGATYAARLKSGAAVLASHTIVAGQTYGWRAATCENVTGVDLTNLQIEFEILTGSSFSNIYAAHVMAEFI